MLPKAVSNSFVGMWICQRIQRFLLSWLSPDVHSRLPPTDFAFILKKYCPTKATSNFRMQCLILKTGLAFAFCGLLAGRASADEAAMLFEKSVRPLFERKCFECHSSKADELKGNLKLETMEQVLKGGATGPAVIAGDIENSFLLRAMRYQEDDFQMPPSGRLPDEDIALVEKWVKALKAIDKRTVPDHGTGTLINTDQH